MDPSKIGYYFSKLFIEDDESDLVRFTFVGHEKKIKCHKSILAEKSEVFKTMFGANWTENGSVEMDDAVEFEQYEMFKLFIELLYEIRNTDSLTLYEATAIHFYAHKYQISDLTEKILTKLNIIVESGIMVEPFTVEELKEGLQFGQLYELHEFNEKLDLVQLAFSVDDPHEFFSLAKEYQKENLKEQVIDYLKTVPPDDTWTLEVSHLVVAALQDDIIRYQRLLR